MKNIPNNEIWYTTRNHGVLKSFDMYAFGSQLLSNTYEKGMGVLRFNTDLTVIGESAFSLCDELVTVELPDSITKIDVGAFSACENLKEFKVPDSVKEIGECAFGLCVNLEKFSGKFTSIDGLCLIVNGILNQFALGCGMEEYTIPNDVREIGWSAFSDSELTKINLHENIIKIGISAFCGCQNLTHINIPNSITTIADVAFQDCINLKNIFIPKTVTNLGSEIFEGCNNILVKYEDESIKISKDKGLKQLLEEYVALQKDVPNGWIYSGDKTAKIIHVPYGVTLVKSEAFEGCDNVEVIHLPQTIEEIEDGAFTDLDNLYRFESDYASPDGKCLIIKNTLVGFAAKDIEEYELPTGFAKVAPMVFYNKEQIKTIIIPEGVLSIGDEAFMGCLNLYHIKLPSSLNFIGYKTFADCISLRKIVVPNSVKVICGNNFQGCEHLEEVTEKALNRKLTEGKDSAYLSKELATIQRNLDINLFYKKCILCCSKQDKLLCKTCSKQIKNFKKDFDKFINSKPVYSVFYYKNEIKKLILKYKFQSKKSLYKDFSEFLIEYYINSELKNIENPIFIPIPSHFIKNFKRGYCHNNLIIKDFCDCLKLDYNFNILGLIGVMINYKVKRENYFYCAEFVKYVLEQSNICNLPEIIKPEDFKEIDNLNVVYNGVLQEYGN